jgi:hypothetical protein
MLLSLILVTPLLPLWMVYKIHCYVENSFDVKWYVAYVRSIIAMLHPRYYGEGKTV